MLIVWVWIITPKQSLDSVNGNNQLTLIYTPFLYNEVVSLIARLDKLSQKKYITYPFVSHVTLGDCTYKSYTISQHTYQNICQFHK